MLMSSLSHLYIRRWELHSFGLTVTFHNVPFFIVLTLGPGVLGRETGAWGGQGCNKGPWAMAGGRGGVEWVLLHDEEGDSHSTLRLRVTKVGPGDSVRGAGDTKKPDWRASPLHPHGARCHDVLGSREPRTRAWEQTVGCFPGSVVGGRHLLQDNTRSKAAH